MYNKVIEILNKAVVKDIRVYEMSSITPFYDYSIIASVSTARQGNAAVNYLKKMLKRLDYVLEAFLVVEKLLGF